VAQRQYHNRHDQRRGRALDRRHPTRSRPGGRLAGGNPGPDSTATIHYDRHDRPPPWCRSTARRPPAPPSPRAWSPASATPWSSVSRSAAQRPRRFALAFTNVVDRPPRRWWSAARALPTPSRSITSTATAPWALTCSATGAGQGHRRQPRFPAAPASPASSIPSPPPRRSWPSFTMPAGVGRHGHHDRQWLVHRPGRRLLHRPRWTTGKARARKPSH